MQSNSVVKVHILKVTGSVIVRTKIHMNKCLNCLITEMKLFESPEITPLDFCFCS